MNPLRPIENVLEWVLNWLHGTVGLTYGWAIVVLTIVVRAAGNGYELLFHDDGPGFGTQAADGQRTTFGLELVKMLAEQLNGKVRYLTGAGSTVHLTFVPDAIPLRVAS